MMTKIKMKWQDCQNPCVSILHTNIMLFRHFGCLGSDLELKNLNSDQIQLIEGILSIHGVETVSTDKYHLQIRIGVMFEWGIIKPLIEQILIEWCG